MEHADRLPLTVERIKELWSNTYNTQGKPDWSHLYPYYDEHIRFQDSIQGIEGKEAFIAMCDRLARRCRQLDMELHTIVRDGEKAVLQWTMTMRFRRFPSAPVEGCSVLTINTEELIVSQRDYYDLWGDIYNRIPLYNRLYRLFMRTFFG